MAFEQKNDSGALFKNNKTKDTQPDYTGDAMVNGSKLRISAWIKKSAQGKTFMSLAFSPPRDAHTSGERTYDPPPQRNAPPARVAGATIDDDVPFNLER